MSSGEAFSTLLCPPNSLSIIRAKSVAGREPRSDTNGDINMSSTSPAPHKRKLSQPDVDSYTEPKKQKLTESNTNTLPLKSATKSKDAVENEEGLGGDLKPPKKTTAKKVKPSISTKPGVAGATLTSKPPNASEEFPNGHLYCHQCNKKRDASRELYPAPRSPTLTSFALTTIPQRLLVAQRLRGSARQSIASLV